MTSKEEKDDVTYRRKNQLVNRYIRLYTNNINNLHIHAYKRRRIHFLSFVRNKSNEVFSYFEISTGNIHITSPTFKLFL